MFVAGEDVISPASAGRSFMGGVELVASKGAVGALGRATAPMPLALSYPASAAATVAFAISPSRVLTPGRREG